MTISFFQGSRGSLQNTNESEMGERESEKEERGKEKKGKEDRNSCDDSLGASNKPNGSRNSRQKLSKSMIVAKLRGLKSLFSMNAFDKEMARHLFEPLSRAAGVSEADSVLLWNFINGEGYCDIERIVCRRAAP